MNILLYTDADVFAGTERHMLDLACALRGLGENVRIGCPRPGALAERADAAGVPVLAIPKTGQVDRHAIDLLTRLLAGGGGEGRGHGMANGEGELDIVHAHNGRTHIAAAFAVRKARRMLAGGSPCRRIACVATQHFLAPARTTHRGPKRLIATYLHRRASRSTAHTIAISDAVRQAAIARGDGPPSAMTTVHNGIAAPVLANAQDADSLRRSLRLSPESCMIFCAARLEPEKDIGTLIEAMAQLARQHPGARCFIAGAGSEQAALQARIAELNAGSCVTLLGFRNDIPALLRACDLFVLPSRAEPFGLAIVEAMAMGKPVIATNTGGPCEIVEDSRTGVLVSPGDAAALAAALQKLHADANLRTAMGQAGYARFLDRFTAARMALEVRDIYRNALGIRPGPLASAVS